MKGGKNLCKNICQKNLISLIEHAYSLPPLPIHSFFYIFRFDENLNIELYYNIIAQKHFFLTQTHYNNPQISSWKTTFSLFFHNNFFSGLIIII